ncbi:MULTISPECIES: HypC/HybG/HupF family hydrogenase formation chaperone [Nitrospirillum]|uniref:Hydrogenase maturation factor HypC n=1 Tax=Nitrospirillum amazonense TaxID=28077 RepID=A0A560GDZ3_9PROT|nr:HypC/HybG/HupF family hydrogenase formation chaperone [Nitrospirillum amazonense]MEC4590961.1 HypC/HybG/HupF family hydrogenase formation chaperone [Nitrospirillum amazonense]TWB32126.1 hydrogenase expression/formation protein HypC [Nitrospirillum amazonense]
MCLAIPALVTALHDGAMASVSVGGIAKQVSVALLEQVAVGDYVLLHVGYALHRVSEEEARRTLAMMAEAGLLQAEVADMGGTAKSAGVVHEIR